MGAFQQAAVVPVWRVLRPDAFKAPAVGRHPLGPLDGDASKELVEAGRRGEAVATVRPRRTQQGRAACYRYLVPMPDGEFEFDVAFSFLSQDEQAATEINGLLKDRWKTFIYFEHQKTLVGRDGEEAFGQVFGNEARLVVILYRPEWGSTRWTRVEETAIRNRGLEEGYAFTVLIPLDQPQTRPGWLPLNRLWGNLHRFGVQGAAQAIEARLEEAGAGSRPETIEQKAARIFREVREDKERVAFIAGKGNALPAQEAAALLDRITERATKIAQPQRITPHIGAFIMGGVRLLVGWYPSEFFNAVDEGRLHVVLELPERQRRGFQSTSTPRRQVTQYVFDVARVSHTAVWRPERGNDPPLSNEALAEVAMHRLVDAVEQARGSGR